MTRKPNRPRRTIDVQHFIATGNIAVAVYAVATAATVASSREILASFPRVGK